MSIYKPTNCHPFATAVDITKSFMRLENTDGHWDYAQPPGVYVTCKIESSNSQIIGYRLRLYENDRQIFAGGDISPISELPRFEDDPSVNTGINGTYLAIPFFQPDFLFNHSSRRWENYHITDSFNAIYCSGTSGNKENDPCTVGVLVDYVLARQDNLPASDGEFISVDQDDRFDSNWRFMSSQGISGYVPTYDTGDVLTINGGCVVLKNDVVLVPEIDTSASPSYPVFWLCTLGDGLLDGKPYLERHKTICRSGDEPVDGFFPIYVKKGKYVGFYQVSLNSSDASVVKMTWTSMFRTIDSYRPNVIFRGTPEDSVFSWEIELYQGPEKYDDLLTRLNLSNYPGLTVEYIDYSKIQQRYYDINVASGTILGSNAKRFHLSSTDGRHLPGYQLTSVPVLQNTFCEIYYSDNDRLSGSYQVVNFDSSLGIVYFKDNALTQSELDAYRSAHDEDAQLHARFFKYSVNAADLLSNETVRACYAPEFDPTASSGVDPRSYLVPGCVVDGVELGNGDRVLWNSAYERGLYNGIWVVGSNGLTQPTRPADGDNWADYIGKVILVVGGTYLGHTVMESTATAGPYDLGENGLFFVKQNPIVIFGDSSSASYGAVDGALPFSSAEQYVKPQIVTYASKTGSITYDDEQYPYTYLENTLVSKASLIQIPVVAGTATVLISFPEDLLLSIQRWARIAEVSNDGVFVSTETTTDSEQGHEPEAPEAPQGKSYRLLYSYNYIISHTATPDIDPDTHHIINVHVTYKRRYVDLWVLCDNTQTGVKYKVRSGAYADKIFMMDANSAWWILDPSTYTANVLFNSRTSTYVSPSSAIMPGMLLKLKNGATVSGGPYLKINSFNETFNRITHSRIADPFISYVNTERSPQTPYKYDVMSCYQTSDANGFELDTLLVPVFWPQTKATETPIMVPSSVVFSADICTPPSEHWREGRWVLTPINGAEAPQDTGWFQKGELDCRFIGLEADSTYRVSLYAKDKWGRVTNYSTLIQGKDGPVSPYSSSPYPGTLKASLDCSTQSVLIEYIPENGDYTGWPDSIPDGSYDVYRREYADFSIEGCPYFENGISQKDSKWYGGWEPVAIGVVTPTIRDFNIKQGHSYQYAILPRAFSLSEMKFKYYIYLDDGRILYDENDQQDEYLPKNAPFFYKIGYSADGNTPYLFCVERESDSTIPDPFAGDVFLYGGEYELDGKSYDLWRRQEADNQCYGFLTNRVVPFGLPHYLDILANEGNPVYVQWSDWSLVELENVDSSTLFSDRSRCPGVKAAYKADLNNIWLFKYDVEDGSQTINIAKSEFNSMGEFPQFFTGELNSESGEISCWLGSEIAKGSRLGYVERRRRSIFAPLSTNEAAAMLAEWRKIIKSGKPKLLRDRKGRSWIVQLSAGSSATQGTYPGRPTKISFSWKQIGDTTDHVIVYGDGDDLDKVGQSGVWKPHIIKSS